MQSEVNEATEHTEVEAKDEPAENGEPIISLNENVTREHQQQQFIVKKGLRKRTKRAITAHSKTR